MKPEKTGYPLSPFERLRGLFDEIPEKSDRVMANGSREIKLGDNTSVSIFRGIVGTVDVNDKIFYVHIEPPDKSVNLDTEFSIMEDGLLSLIGPKLILRKGEMLMTGEDAKNLNPAINQDRLVLAGELVDWTSKIMAENKYKSFPTSSFE